MPDSDKFWGWASVAMVGAICNGWVGWVGWPAGPTGGGAVFRVEGAGSTEVRVSRCDGANEWNGYDRDAGHVPEGLLGTAEQGPRLEVRSG